MLPCCTCDCAPTVCWTMGFVAFLPVLRSSLLWVCWFLWVLFSHLVHNLRDGVTPAGLRLVYPRSERRFRVFSISLLGCFFVFTALRDIVTIWVRCVGRSHSCATDGCRGCFALSPSGWASTLCLRLLLVPCHCRCVSWWSSLRKRVFGCP